jgi:hypothetical protein
LLKPKTISRVIIDADIIAYRAAAANDSYPDPLRLLVATKVLLML